VDVERTIEFLLEQAARSEARIERLERMQAATDKRVRAILPVMKLGYQRMVRHEKLTEARFRRVDQRFEKMDQRFEKMDERFEKNDARIRRMLELLLGRRNGNPGNGRKK
jgi:hypothetical protein